MGRRVTMYFSWDRTAESGAPLTVLDDRFPALFEVRRLFWPAYEALGDEEIPGQGIGGFIDQILLQNFRLFAELTQNWTGSPVRVLHRKSDAGTILLDGPLLRECETLVLMSYDTCQSRQQVTPAEVDALREFLAHPDHTVFVCLHHAVGDASGLQGTQRLATQKAEFDHHGDRAIPGRQRFGYFALSLMQSLGMPIRNRFGFRPAIESDGRPTPFERAAAASWLLADVQTLNAHPHLPHFERVDQGAESLEVVVRQRIDQRAPPHPFAPEQRLFDSILQARPGLFRGNLFVTDTTVWSSAAGGLSELQKLWRNVALGHVTE